MVNGLKLWRGHDTPTTRLYHPVPQDPPLVLNELLADHHKTTGCPQSASITPNSKCQQCCQHQQCYTLMIEMRPSTMDLHLQTGLTW